MALDACYEFTEAETFLLAHAGMMGDRATVLHRDDVAHFVVHFEDHVEKLRLHLNIWLLYHFKTYELL